MNSLKLADLVALIVTSSSYCRYVREWGERIEIESYRYVI